MDAREAFAHPVTETSRNSLNEPGVPFGNFGITGGEDGYSRLLAIADHRGSLKDDEARPCHMIRV
jgi:hypothetical protein